MKKFFKSPWTISISTALISFLLSVIYDLTKGNQIFSTIGRFFLTIRDVVVAFLCLNIKLWWIIIGICSVLIILNLVSKMTANKDTFKPDFKSYTKDYFKNWKWSWNWKFSNYHKNWIVSDLVPHCPKCDTPMLSDKYEDIFQCPRCKFQSQYKDHEKSYEVEAVIIDNLNRKKQSNQQEC